MKAWGVAVAAASVLGLAAAAAAQDGESLRRELEALERRRAEILRALEGEGAPPPAAAPAAAPAAPAGTAVPPGAPPAAADAPRGAALMEAVEVVATGFREERGASIPSVKVVEGSWYRDRAIPDVAEGLRQVPGVAVSRGGTPGAATSLFVRGAASNQVLVLQDGMPLNDPTAGSQFNFFDLDALNLDRVEVLRGSHGALYGSDAVGGVVNLVSRRGSGPGTFGATATLGSFGTHRETLTGSGGDESLDWSLGIAETGTDGPHDRQAFSSLSFSGLFGGRFAGDGRWQVAARSLDSTAEDPYDFGPTLPEDDNIRRERDLLALGLTLEKPLASWLEGRVRASVTDIDSAFRNGGDAPGAPAEFTSTTQATTTEVGAALRAAWPREGEGGIGVSAILGGDYRAQESLSASESPFGGGIDIDETTYNGGAYLLGTVEAGPATLSAGTRLDDHSQYGREWSPQAGARVAVAPTGPVLRANYGEGFRAPTPAEFADPFVGNPDLGPETSQSLDAGVEQEILPWLRAEAGWFRLRTRDLIAWDATTFVLENFSRTETEGYEAGVRAEIGSCTTLFANWTHQRPRDLVTGDPLPNRPEDFATLGVEWRRGDWMAAANLYWQGPVPDLGFTGPDADLRRHPGRRLVMNLTGRWMASETVTLFARIENLWNEEYVETPSAPKGLPFSIFAGVSLDF